MASRPPEKPGNGEFCSEEMIAVLYTELRSLAAAKLMKLPAGQTLQATALVHEAFVRLAGDPSARWQNRSHFFAAAAEAMRRILVDQARKKAARRHGGGVVSEPLDELRLAAPEPEDRILAVHEALEKLKAEDEELAQVAKLRFFAGLSHEETAGLLGISEKTARRQWTAAKVRLFEIIEKDSSS